MNMDVENALNKLSETLVEKEIGLRNLIAGLRIDHRMLPDADHFIKQLHPLLDKRVDLIITIGKGFTNDEFTGRAKVMGELFNYLQDAGLRPVLLKLHGRGSIEEQRETPCFGLASCTTYEVLYCRLLKR